MAAGHAINEALKRLRNMGCVAPEMKEERLKYIEECLVNALAQLEAEETLKDGVQKLLEQFVKALGPEAVAVALDAAITEAG